MARRQERPAIISDDIDRFIERMFISTAALLLAGLVAVQLFRWIVR